MNALSTTLKTILNGLAMQYEGDFISTEDKQANMQRVLRQIEQEKKSGQHVFASTPAHLFKECEPA